jgi:hypothetical protein
MFIHAIAPELQGFVCHSHGLLESSLPFRSPSCIRLFGAPCRPRA